MRVVIEVPDERGGTGTYARQLAATLPQLTIPGTGGPIEVVSACYRRLPKERYGRQLSRLLNSFRMLHWAQIALPRICRSEKADLLHCPAFVCPLCISRPVVLTVLDLTHIRYPETMDPIWRRYLQLFFRASIRRADRIITISEAAAQEVEEHYPSIRDKVVATPIAPAAAFGPETDSFKTRQVLEALGIARPYFLFVGSLNPRKNVTGVVAAFQQFKKATGLPHQLVVVGGKGWLMTEIERVLAGPLASGDAILTGYTPVEDLTSLYHAAEALLMPSLYEGFGIPVAEAMVSGCPVITSNTSSLPEVAGDAGLLVDPMNSADIAAAMRRVASDGSLRQTMIERGYRQAARFSWEQTAAATAKVYEDAMRAFAARKP